MRIRVQFDSDSKGGGALNALAAAGLLATDLLTPDGAPLPIPVFNSTIRGGNLIYTDQDGVMSQDEFLLWDDVNFRLGVRENNPQDNLHMSGSFRIDNLFSQVINMKFGNTVSTTQAALIQYRAGEAYGFGIGALLFGLGWSSASVGVTGEGLILSTGCKLTFSDANIQAGLTGGSMWGGTGVPSNDIGANGDYYLRSDTPGSANQRLYVKAADVWTGIL